MDARGRDGEKEEITGERERMKNKMITERNNYKRNKGRDGD